MIRHRWFGTLSSSGSILIRATQKNSASSPSRVVASLPPRGASAMASCAIFSPDTLKHPPPNSRRSLDYGEALRLLDHSKSPNQVKQAHARILRHGLSCNPTLLAKLLRLYSAHSRLDLASRVFAQLPDPPSTLAWNLIIRAHALNDAPRESILIYNRMISRGIPPDKFTFPFTVAACARCADASKGMEIHASSIKAGLYNNPYVQNALIHLYFTCGDPISARQVFDGMRVRTVVSWTALVSGLVASGELDAARAVFDVMPRVRNVVTWTAMIDGYARNAQPSEAFELFQMMQEEKVQPNEFTVVALLIACTELGSLSLGHWVHDFARKNGGMERGVYVGTALIDMYSKCGSLEDALRVFHQMPIRSLATWNSMITSLGVHGHGKEAISLFREMERVDLRPDRITLVGVLCACARTGMVEEGFRLFRYITGHYAIAAGFEHYNCLLELCGSELSEEMHEVVRNLVMELDAESQRMLLAASRKSGNIDLQTVFCSNVQETTTSEEGCSTLPITENQCYRWEVG